jgi:hypothetical protein
MSARMAEVLKTSLAMPCIHVSPISLVTTGNCARIASITAKKSSKDDALSYTKKEKSRVRERSFGYKPALRTGFNS